MAFSMKLKKKKKLSSLPTRFINMFERSYGTFRRGGGKPTIVNDIGSIFLKKLVYLIFF
jgi:hypothetical protein